MAARSVWNRKAPGVKTYRVKWEIDVDAPSHEAAAKRAQEWMDEGTSKWTFLVKQGKDKAVKVDMEKVP